jgi:hypothetical protein
MKHEYTVFTNWLGLNFKADNMVKLLLSLIKYIDLK